MTAVSLLRSFPATILSKASSGKLEHLWDEEGLKIVRRNVSEDSKVSISDDMKNIEMTESCRPPEGRRRAPL